MNNLTPVQLAAMLIRLFGLYVLWVALDAATYFPTYWMRSEVAHSSAGLSLRSSLDVGLVMLYVRFGLHVVVVMYLTAQPFPAAEKLVNSVLKPPKI